MLSTLALASALLQAVPDTGRTQSGLWYSVSGTGPTVLLIHGANLDSRSWGALPDALVKDHRVVQLELRSHGRSSDASGPFSWSADILEVLSAVRAQRAVLIGHSLGASIAVDAALEHPGRVRGIVLLGPGVSGMQTSMPSTGYEAFIAALSKGDLALAGDELGRTPFARLFKDTTRQAEVRTIVRENVRLFRARREWITPIDPPAFARIETLAVPVYVVMGAQDPSESNAAGRVVLEKVKGATGITLPGCGHMLQLDCTAEVIAGTLAFLAGLKP